MVACFAVGCTSRSEDGFKMHYIPRDQTRRKLWLSSIGRIVKPEEMPKNPVLCQVHFEPDQYEKVRVDGKMKLKWNAVPTLFDRNAGKVKRKRKAFPPRKPESEVSHTLQPDVSTHQHHSGKSQKRSLNRLKKDDKQHPSDAGTGQQSSNTASSSTVLCNTHFDDSQYVNYDRTDRLKYMAVPTIFPKLPNSPELVQSEENSKRKRKSNTDLNNDTKRSALEPQFEKEEPLQLMFISETETEIMGKTRKSDEQKKKEKQEYYARWKAGTSEDYKLRRKNQDKERHERKKKEKKRLERKQKREEANKRKMNQRTAVMKSDMTVDRLLQTGSELGRICPVLVVAMVNGRLAFSGSDKLLEKVPEIQQILHEPANQLIQMFTSVDSQPILSKKDIQILTFEEKHKLVRTLLYSDRDADATNVCARPSWYPKNVTFLNTAEKFDCKPAGSSLNKIQILSDILEHYYSNLRSVDIDAEKESYNEVEFHLDV